MPEENDHGRYHESREQYHGLEHKSLEERQATEIATLHARLDRLEKHAHRHEASEDYDVSEEEEETA
jgi:hypothetical protein